ncbi:TonB-dependent siderophore receptor [Phenylobacterium sp.]|uniref:TonB-dependent receptor plug domain-containing protein n=1 Tax=Phenylobacterium sp. TaxID=1871053 RepID=UPI002736461B|nr:TonB-dependent receptor [Phenylobacterium sp.]MDP3855687.1 TonB-dependent receptor [Phenylobacterium sp.]
MLKSRYFCGGSVLAVALALGLSGQAAAQDQASTVEEVVVTGSFIAGTPEDAALPVDVIGQDELQKRGSPTTIDLIKTLPVSGPVLGDSNQFSTAAQGQSGAGTINLRGLGSLRTLVLFNGRRTVPSAGAGSGGVDTNLIPSAAVGRVEILKDGAAATYGSDAIAGVVNFITRKNFSGLELSADYRYVDGSDGDYSASAVYGWVGENGNILISAGYQHRSELTTLDRDWAYRPYTTNPSGWSILGQPPSFLPRNGVVPTAGVQRDANCAAVGGFAGFSGTTPACYFTYIPFDNLIEDENRYQIYAEANVDFTDTMRLHVEAMYSKTDLPHMRFSPGFPPIQGPNGPGSVGVFTTPITNPGALTALQQAGLSPAQIAATNNISLTLFRPLGAGGNPIFDNGGQVGFRNYDIYRVSADLSGKFGDTGIGWDTAVTYSQTRNVQGTPDIITERLQKALNGLGGPGCTGTTPGANGCKYFNPFSNAYSGNPALGLTNPGFVSANANSPELIRWFFDFPATDQKQSLLVLDAVINGELPWELSGGKIGWAAGAQYRRTEFQSSLKSPLQDSRITPCPTIGSTSCSFPTGPYIFLGQSTPQQLEDSVYAVFAETNLPITDSLNAQLAIRFEDYGGETGSTTNPKLAVKWQLTDAFALRGSVGTTFRGPTPANRSSNSVTGLSAILAAGNNFKSVDFAGNPAIGPEKATTFNIGGIFEAYDFRVIVDYWNFKIEEQITTVPAQIVATAVGGVGNGTQFVNCGSVLRSLITFNNNNACVQGVTIGNDIQRVKSDTVNGPEMKIAGVDVSIDYRNNDVFGGTFGAGVAVSHLLQYDIAEFSVGGALVSRAYEALGFTNYDRFPGTVSRFRGNAFAEYGIGAHNLRADLTYVDGAVDNRAPVSVQNTTGALQLITIGMRVEDFYSLDLNYRLQLPWDTTVTASVFNLLDRDPSAARLEVTYDPFIGNPYGRTFKVGVRKKF